MSSAPSASDPRTGRRIAGTIAAIAGVSCHRAIDIDPAVRARTYEGRAHLVTTHRRLACGITASWYADNTHPPVTCGRCLRRPEARQ